MLRPTTTTAIFILFLATGISNLDAFHHNVGRRLNYKLAATSDRQRSEHTGEEFSRSLSTKEKRERIRRELEVKDEAPAWRRRLLKPFQTIKERVSSLNSVEPGHLILLKCGESVSRKAGIFTGWADPDLTQLGMQESEHAARLLLEAGYEPDLIYTSVLKRAVHTTWIVTKEMDNLYKPVLKSWRLNERMYGAVQGLSKQSVADKLGEPIVQAWRNDIMARPPPVARADPYHPRNFLRYNKIDDDLLPVCESLHDCMERTRPLWEYKISRQLRAGNNVLVVGHSNSLRGLAKIIDDIPDGDTKDINFPPGIPVVYKFDKDFNPVKPTDGSLMQSHTSGMFLEKPGLLEKALQRVVAWKQSIPAATRVQFEASIKRQRTPFEESLYMLKLAQGMKNQPAHGYDLPSNTTDSQIVTGLTDKAEESGDFEEDIHLKDQLDPSVVANVDEVDVDKDLVVVLVRHGTTSHNELKLFTGWEDPPLTEGGIEDAKQAGRVLKHHGFEFDVVYTSWLARAIETAWFIMSEMDREWLPVVKSWRLNERHYGALTGKSKKMIGNIYGDDQLKKWRRGYDIPPPQASSYSFHYPGNDYRRTKYVNDLRISFSESLSRSLEAKRPVIHRKFPKSESLKMCMDRTIPFYTEKIVPEAVAEGKRVLITSHENALRGILMHLCDIPVEHMNELHIPNGLPLVYNVRRKCISLLEDEEGNVEDPSIFGSAAKYLFRPCDLFDEDFEDANSVRPNENEDTASTPIITDSSTTVVEKQDLISTT